MGDYSRWWKYSWYGSQMFTYRERKEILNKVKTFSFVHLDFHFLSKNQLLMSVLKVRIFQVVWYRPNQINDKAKVDSKVVLMTFLILIHSIRTDCYLVLLYKCIPVNILQIIS